MGPLFEPRVSEHSAEHEVKMLMTFEAFGCSFLRRMGLRHLCVKIAHGRQTHPAQTWSCQVQLNLPGVASAV